MIKAKRDQSFEWMFHLVNKRLLRMSFEQIYFQKKDELPKDTAIFVCNHSSWWDGLICFHLRRTVLSHYFYVMMHEHGLKKYPYFKKLGAFSINRSNPKEVFTTLEYTIDLLFEEKSVWIFPQGDEFHLEKRPLNFQSGVLYVLEKCPHIPIIPFSFYYSFGHKRKPEVSVLAGQAFHIEDLHGKNRKEKTASLEQICTKQLDELKKMVIEENHYTFSTLL